MQTVPSIWHARHVSAQGAPIPRVRSPVQAVAELGVLGMIHMTNDLDGRTRGHFPFLHNDRPSP
mgnify:CR=1 FL=1